MNSTGTKKRKNWFVEHVELMQRVIYFLCFMAILLSMSAIIVNIYKLPYLECILYCVVFLDCLIIILHKAYTRLTELSILGVSVDKALRGSSFIEHDNYFVAVSDEVRRFCRILCVIVAVSIIGYGFAFGALSRFVAFTILLVIVILKLKNAIYYFAAGKIFDRTPGKRKYIVFRGYAKLFLNEYLMTGFRRKNPLYKNNLYYCYDHNDEKQDLSVKSVLFFEGKYQIKHESNKLIAIIIFAIMVFLLVFYPPTEAFFKNALEYLQLYPLSHFPWKLLSVFLLNTLLCLVSATTLLHYKYTCSYIKQIVERLNSGSSWTRMKLYWSINSNKSDYRRIRSMGLMTVCADRGYTGLPNDSKEIINRPLFRHLIYTPIKEYLLYLGALILSLALFFSTIFNVVTMMMIIVGALLYSLIIHYIVAPLIKIIIMKSWCAKILKNQGVKIDEI